jgi:hypothetical protein
MENPALLKKRILIRSKFFSQLLRSFESLAGDIIKSFNGTNLENNNFPLHGSFNFVDISLEHQLKLNHKLRKMDSVNQFMQNSSKKDSINHIFRSTINITNFDKGKSP